MSKYKHKQVRAKFPNGPSVWVDEDMKKFLEALWDREIDTVLSCQENESGVAWVEFAEPYDAIRFLEAAWDLADDEMRDRMEGEWDVPGMWNVNAHQWYLDNGIFTLNVGLRLPIEDKDRLAELLAEAIPVEQPGEGVEEPLVLAGFEENMA